MLFDFYPWQLDIDVDLTKQFYEKIDDLVDGTANMEFLKSLSLKQQYFFHSLGVDLTKVDVDKVVYEICADEETPASKICRISVHFFMRGKILALPKYQKDLYSKDDVFGEKFPKSVKVLPSDDKEYLKVFDNGIGAGIVFKHPCFHYDDEKFKVWDCGYILGSILIMQDIQS